METIPFNKPYLTGKENFYIYKAVQSGKLSGNGIYTKKCQEFFETNFGFRKTLLTTSCTDALEMCAMLLNIQPGDEIILPSYTFVSTAIAFVREGASLVFADSEPDQPNISLESIRANITNKTKAIVVVHYAGVACDMENIRALADENNIYLIEDAAQAIDSYFTYADGSQKPLGTIGHLSAFSFHETKNIICGEGGLLGVNDPQFIDRSEVLWEKGTNRAEFFRGEVNKYGWVDTGSSFLPSEVNAAFLWAQLENLEDIQSKRKHIWERYMDYFAREQWQPFLDTPIIPSYASNNAHMFYFVTKNPKIRTTMIAEMKSQQITAVFHYLSLHASEYWKPFSDGRNLPHSDRYTENLVRMPLFYELEDHMLDHIFSVLDTILVQLQNTRDI